MTTVCPPTAGEPAVHPNPARLAGAHFSEVVHLITVCALRQSRVAPHVAGSDMVDWLFSEIVRSFTRG